MERETPLDDTDFFSDWTGEEDSAPIIYWKKKGSHMQAKRNDMNFFFFGECSRQIFFLIFSKAVPRQEKQQACHYKQVQFKKKKNFSTYFLFLGVCACVCVCVVCSPRKLQK